MPAFFIYILKSSIGLGLIYCFYRLLLQRLTFFRYNRYYLLGGLVFALLSPLIQFDISKAGEHPMRQVVAYLPDWSFSADTLPVLPVAPMQEPSLAWLWWLYAIGAGFIMLRLLVQLLSLRRLLRKTEPLEQYICHTNEPVTPFSFFNRVVVNTRLHSERQMAMVFTHELAHVKQRHWADILFIELVLVLQWFNPFAWLMRRAIRQNLEFVADKVVLDSGCNSREYQLDLLSLSTNAPTAPIAISFNFFHLKKRIIMMNKNRSRTSNLVLYTLLLPVIGCLLFSFNYKEVFEYVSNKDVYVSGFAVDANTKQPLPGVSVTGSNGVALKETTDAKGFFRMNLSSIPAGVKYTVSFSKGGYDDSRNALGIDGAPRNLVIVVEMKQKSATSNTGTMIYLVDDIGAEETRYDKSLVYLKNYQQSIDRIVEKRATEIVKPTVMEVPASLLNERPVVREEPVTVKDTVPVKVNITGKVNEVRINRVFNGGSNDMKLNTLLKEKPLIVLDRKVIEIDADDLLKKINPMEIATINVYKAETATRLYGERGRNGVVEVFTKTFASGNLVFTGDKISVDDKTGNMVISDKVTIDGNFDNYIVMEDDQVIPREKVNHFMKMNFSGEPKTINIIRVEVYKAENARAVYSGSIAGKKGVIKVVTK
jgi:BlaR1 peptidase M56